MKRADLEALGIEKESIDKIMKWNGDDINRIKRENETLNEKLTEAQTQLQDANDKLKENGDKDEVINKLQKEMEDYIKAENERKEREKAEKAEKELEEKIIAVFPEDKEFTSNYVRSGIISDIKAKLKEDSTKGAKEIFEDLTKDQEGIFKNPQHEKITIPGTEGGLGEEKHEFKSFF